MGSDEFDQIIKSSSRERRGEAPPEVKIELLRPDLRPPPRVETSTSFTKRKRWLQSQKKDFAEQLEGIERETPQKGVKKKEFNFDDDEGSLKCKCKCIVF